MYNGLGLIKDFMKEEIIYKQKRILDVLDFQILKQWFGMIHIGFKTNKTPAQAYTRAPRILTGCDNSRTYVPEVRQYYGLVLPCFQSRTT